MVWPPNSPDLNPIEILWVFLKQRIAHRLVKSTVVVEIRDAIDKEYAAITGEEMYDIIVSVVEQVKKILAAEGGQITY